MSYISNGYSEIFKIITIDRDVDGELKNVKTGDKIPCKKIEFNYDLINKLNLETYDLNTFLKFEISYFNDLRNENLIMFEDKVYKFRIISKNKRFFQILLLQN